MANRPIEIKGTKKKLIKASIWDNGGVTFIKSIPPKKDDPEGEWREQKISFFDNEIETAIEVLTKVKEQQSGLGGTGEDF